MNKTSLINTFKKHCADSSTYLDRAERLKNQHQSTVRVIQGEDFAIRIVKGDPGKIILYTPQMPPTGVPHMHDLDENEYNELEKLYAQ